MQTYYFNIADFCVTIRIPKDYPFVRQMLSSLAPFQTEAPEGDHLLTLTIDDDLQPMPESKRELIRAFDTGNGDTVVERLEDGGYQYIVKNIVNRACALIITNKDFSEVTCALRGNFNMRCFGFNNALMLVLAFAGAPKEMLIIHASTVRHKGYGYPFIAKSGTGKSTQVSMWLRHIPDCDLMNDDTPIVRFKDGEFWIYGSPWSGKTPCYRQVKARLGAITRIARGEENKLLRMPPLQAFASFLPSCSSMKWESELYNHTCNTVAKVVENVGIYTLECLPNEEAARICFDGIAREK